MLSLFDAGDAADHGASVIGVCLTGEEVELFISTDPAIPGLFDAAREGVVDLTDPLVSGA